MQVGWRRRHPFIKDVRTAAGKARRLGRKARALHLGGNMSFGKSAGPSWHYYFPTPLGAVYVVIILPT